MRSRRRRCPTEHVLLAGMFDDLDSIQMALSLLSPTCYGQVIIEADDVSLLPKLDTPPRVSVLMVRSAEFADPSASTGAALSQAVAGWVNEWIPEEPAPERRVSVWVGAKARAHVRDQRFGLDGLIQPL